MRRIFGAIAGRTKRAATPVQCANYPEVDLFHWSPPYGGRNFGDHLSKIIAACVASEHGLTFDDEVSEQKRMLGIGSVLHFAKDGDVVWGSGWNGKMPVEQLTATRLDIRAVRGPLTAKLLSERGFSTPSIFGDPGLLTPRYFRDRFPVDPQTPFIVIPNLNDRERAADVPNVVSPLRGWNHVVRAITTARKVVTSSLHGLILAEAFGVPVHLIRFSEAEHDFKFEDYAQGTGRDRLPVAATLDAALAAPDYPAMHFDEDALVAAFPTDLWR